MKFMENAVRFEREPNKVRVKLRLSVDGTHEIELRTILEAMDVSLHNALCFFCLNKVGSSMICLVVGKYQKKCRKMFKVAQPNKPF